MSIASRLKGAWNAFRNDKETQAVAQKLDNSAHSYSSPFYKYYRYSKGSIVDTIITRIAMDVSMIEFRHVKYDKDGKTELDMKSGLNRCLTLEANIDQSYMEFMHDLVFSMMDEGVVAVVPTHTDGDPNTESYEVLALRVGKVVQWFPQSVIVEVYDEETGDMKQMYALKQNCAIIENPMYSIVNGENSTLKRLSRKLAILDKLDENSIDSKLDLIIQMPYSTKGESRQEAAKKRVQDIQDQLKNSEYGIAYIDTNEHITQLNRAVNNNLLSEIESLTNELFNQLGLTEKVFNGTATEQELRSYYNRTVTPIVKRIALEFNRKFITDTGRSQGQRISYVLDRFQLVPIEQLASSAQTFKTQAILTTNEIRGIIGFQPSDDPTADMLYNPNITDATQTPQQESTKRKDPDKELVEQLEAEEKMKEEEEE